MGPWLKTSPPPKQKHKNPHFKDLILKSIPLKYMYINKLAYMWISDLELSYYTEGNDFGKGENTIIARFRKRKAILINVLWADCTAFCGVALWNLYGAYYTWH